jgi:hypothetical protein
MGNLKETLKRNQHLENQNKGLMDALKRRNNQLNEVKAQSAKAVAQISTLTGAYIGAICLGEETREVKISHEDVKRVLAEFDLTVVPDEQGITFTLAEKGKTE